jgi:hypothetical protein
LDPVSAHLPVLDEVDVHVCVRGIEGQLIDKPKAVDKTCGTVVPLLIGDAPGVLRRLHLVEQKGMITGFDAEEIAQVVGVQGLQVGGIGTQTVFGDDEREVRVVLAQLGHKAFGGISFTIILRRTIVLAGHATLNPRLPVKSRNNDDNVGLPLSTKM